MQQEERAKDGKKEQQHVQQVKPDIRKSTPIPASLPTAACASPLAPVQETCFAVQQRRQPKKTLAGQMDAIRAMQQVWLVQPIEAPLP